MGSASTQERQWVLGRGSPRPGRCLSAACGSTWEMNPNIPPDKAFGCGGWGWGEGVRRGGIGTMTLRHQCDLAL